MELKIKNELILPESIDFNYEELKAELSEKVQKYETLVYTDEQIKDAKADRATLNKLKKALTDERIRRKKEYLKPFEDFENKINEIISIIDKPVALIDKQVKDFDEKRKADKRIEIGVLWDGFERPDWLTLPKIFEERWLNVGCSMKAIEQDISEKLERIQKDLQTLESMDGFGFEAIDEYKRTLDLNSAISEGRRLADIQKRKEEQKAAQEAAQARNSAENEKADKYVEEAESGENKPVNAAEWITFSALLTIEQALELKAFFDERNITFKKGEEK